MIAQYNGILLFWLLLFFFVAGYIIARIKWYKKGFEDGFKDGVETGKRSVLVHDQLIYGNAFMEVKRIDPRNVMAYRNDGKESTEV